jgi:hypothetical protein
VVGASTRSNLDTITQVDVWVFLPLLLESHNSLVALVLKVFIVLVTRLITSIQSVVRLFSVNSQKSLVYYIYLRYTQLYRTIFHF